MINELSQQIHKNNVAKGFYEDEKNIGEMLCLIHSEVSEALESDRKTHYANVKGSLVLYFPYSGWASGKTIKAGRGLKNLLSQIKNP